MFPVIPSSEVNGVHIIFTEIQLWYEMGAHTEGYRSICVFIMSTQNFIRYWAPGEELFYGNSVKRKWCGGGLLIHLLPSD